MNYLDIANAHTLPERQRSLFRIIAAAQMAAHEGKTRIAVIHAPIYVDEYALSEHVFCPVCAVDVLYPERKGCTYAIDATVEPDGAVFFHNAADALLVVAHSKPEERRISISITEQDEADHWDEMRADARRDEALAHELAHDDDDEEEEAD